MERPKQIWMKYKKICLRQILSDKIHYSKKQFGNLYLRTLQIEKEMRETEEDLEKYSKMIKELHEEYNKENGWDAIETTKWENKMFVINDNKY